MLEEKTDEECTDDNRRTWFSSDHGCDVEIMVAAIDAAATEIWLHRGVCAGAKRRKAR